MQTYQGRLFAANAHHPLLAILHQSTLSILSTSATAPPPSAPAFCPDPSFFAQCKLLHWYRPPHASSAANPPPARLLLASDTAIHVLDAYDPTFHASIAHPFPPTGRLAHAALATADELLTVPDLAPRATLWDLPTGRGVEVRDPKALGRGRGGGVGEAFATRPRSGHLAALTRPAGRDVVVLLGPPGHREATTSFEVAGAVSDAQGLRWSADGRWLAVWEAPSMGAAVALHTPDGQLFRVWRDEGGADDIGLGVERCEWCGEKLCIGLADGRVVVLAGMTLSTYATIRFPSPITAVASTAVILQEQLSTSSSERSYGPAPLPLTPPPPVPTPAAPSPTAHGIVHLAPSPDSLYLATVPATSPTTVWISAIDQLTTVAVLIHHSPIKSLEWSRNAQSLLVRCAITAPEPAHSSTLPKCATYIWRPTRPTEPSIVSFPNPAAPGQLSSPLPGAAPRIAATWLPSDPGENDKQILVSGTDACGIVWVTEEMALGAVPLNYDDQTVTLGGAAGTHLPNADNAPRSLGGTDGAADDTFAFRKRLNG